MDLEPLATTRRADGVFEQLRSRILSGALPPGSQLPNERELAEALGVNRASVREALRRLEFLELVEVRHGHGTFAREVSESSALQVVEGLLRDPTVVTRDLLAQILLFRRHVVLHVAELAATNRTPEQLERARALLDEEESEARDAKRALEIDLQWNALLGEATGNLMYQLLTNLFTKLVRRLGPLYYNERRDHERSSRTHRQMLDAIERRDVDSAHALAETMLAYSEGSILSEVERLEAIGAIGSAARERAR